MSDSDNILDAVATVLTYALAIEFSLDTEDIDRADDGLRAILEPLRGQETSIPPTAVTAELRSHLHQERLDDLVATNPTAGRSAGPPVSLSGWADRLATFIGRAYDLEPHQRLTVTSAVTTALHRLGLRDDYTGRAGNGTATDLLQ